jgi:uncharacterized protein (TIGR02145 family)
MRKLHSIVVVVFISILLPFVGLSQTFKQVKIGSQIWMTQNLNVDRFRNGDLIPEAKTNEEWILASDQKRPAWCYYKNDPVLGAKYGKLYNWYAVNDPRGLAPAGWRVPLDNDWATLIQYLGGKFTAGPKMKSVLGWNSFQTGGSTYVTCPNCKNWNNEYRSKVACHTCRDTRRVEKIVPIVKHSGGGSNTSGFTALPGGKRDPEGYFSNTGFTGFWWSADDNGSGYYASGTALYNIYTFVDFSNDTRAYHRRNGMSVRCVRDAGASDVYESGTKPSTTSKSGASGKTTVVVKQYTKYDAITPADRMKGFKWHDCETKDFPYDFGCKNSKIGQMNECLFDDRLNDIFGSGLFENLKDMAFDMTKKQITKEMYDAVMLDCKKQ